MKQFLEMYREQDIEAAMKRVYNKSPKELNLEFTDFISLFKIDEAIEQRIEAKLMEQ